MEPLAPATFIPAPVPPRAPMRSADGRVELTDDALTVEGNAFSLLELESVQVQAVRWLLWIMMGALTLGGFTLAFLQNWIRTPTAMIGMAAGALLLAWGNRGANRLRLNRLGREAAHYALPGDLAQWQKLASEANQRIYLRHQRAAADAMALLAQQEAEAAARAADLEPGSATVSS
ncbi:hypothetical protein F0P96_03795 [Hymenobacter busanensis]|uniref:Uncharacterized protein n=1 Tax=Hymenobacter busanensis TaxID=2607656 RepID=A0A7L4ZU32_9BACT|nr:hypothetical protein [Hymenobacter busanensis]KAA9339749.1 hypothetical protein F0P96_03795 [Hymenobacter busanensis]QHJ06497.1 hypothetical protein GUY19_03955 [Hymenobacter busanensis]